MNPLPISRRVQTLNCLVDGNSIRSTERMTKTHRAVMRLLVEVGNGYAAIMSQEMRDLPRRRLQVDEIWAYVEKKQRWVTPQDDRRRVGDMWTFVALDPETKLVPTSASASAPRLSRALHAGIVRTACQPRPAFVRWPQHLR